MILKKILAVCFIQFCLLSCLLADETYWDANLVREYVHNSEMQRRWAWAVIVPNLIQLKGDEQILDIGCGDGKITADVSKFVPRGSVIGIDPSKPMLEWARKQFSTLEYPNLSFREGGFLEPDIAEQFDFIISNCALQHCLDQPLAFKNLAKLLKPYGKLCIAIPAIDNTAWKEARKNIQSLSKWSYYWQHILPRKFLSLDEYRELLHAANLSPLRIEKIQTVDPFVDREEFLCFLLGTFTPAVPLTLAKEFYNDLIDEYIRLSPQVLKVNGVIEARFGRIEIEAVRF